MSEKDLELEPIAKKDAAKKYVAVVYHHVSYQNDDGAVCLADDGHGTSKSVRGKQSTSLNQVADVPDYFILALLSLLIFMPTGLVAVVNSLKVTRAVEQEDTSNAIDASNWALQHSLISIFTGPLFACMLFLVLFLPYCQIH